MLFQSGESLTEALREAGMLQDMKRKDGVAEPNCTVFAKVVEYFAQIVYVILRPAGHAPHPEFHDPLCTCAYFCRYAGCEHVEYVKMLALRLRPATSSAVTLPVQKRRGRKRGQTLTVRGAARAQKRWRSVCWVGQAMGAQVVWLAIEPRAG